MTLRVNLLATHFNADEARTLIAFLDQLREVLMNTYSHDIDTLFLQETSYDDVDPSDE